MRRQRGTTLIEIMMVIAILGVMSGLAAAGVIVATRVGRLNGASTSLASALATVRTRALTEHCAYYLQLNGPSYPAASAPLDVPRLPSSALIYRKNDCGSTHGAYDPGLAASDRDRLVEQIPLSEFRADFTFPAAIVGGGVLTSGSVSIGWTSTGRRTVFADDDADGISADMGYPATINVTTTAHGNADTSRTITIPVAGPAKAL